VKLSIDGKVIAKARATSKESRRKASQRTYFALQEKWTKNNIIYQNYIVFVHKLTKSSHFLSNFNRIYLQDYFLSDMAIHKLDLGRFDKVDYNLLLSILP
jgi:hypothetical protein